MTRFINLTPHEINIIDDDGVVVVTIPPSGINCRIDTVERLDCVVEGIKLFTTEYINNSGLPSPEFGVYYITSRLIVGANRDRHDLLAPHGLMRDDKGRVIGCKGLSR
jgi:hypothetical protein